LNTLNPPSVRHWNNVSTAIYVYLTLCILLVSLIGTLISSAGNEQLEKSFCHF